MLLNNCRKSRTSFACEFRTFSLDAVNWGAVFEWYPVAWYDSPCLLKTISGCAQGQAKSLVYLNPLTSVLLIQASQLGFLLNLALQVVYNSNAPHI